MLAVDAHLTLGELDLVAAFDVDAGEVVALVGPNGAGKSTLLRTIAGLQPLERGSIRIAGQVVDEPGTTTFVPPEGRSTGIVFQDDLLFPRLDVLANVAYGLRARGHKRADAERAAVAQLERFGADDLAGRRPSELSGGQAQRVALARAMATTPSVLLLDEPLAALDVTTKVAVRRELRSCLADETMATVLVAHDPIDALVLADRVVVLEHGRVTQAGTTAQVASHPASRYVADLVGLNVLRGSVESSHVIRVDAGGVLHLGSEAPAPTGHAVAVAIRPQAVVLHHDEPEGSARNVWRATVADIESDQERARVTLAGAVPVVAEVTAASVAALGLGVGQAVWASVKAVDLHAYER